MEFKYKARSPEGKISEGVLQADSQDAAVAMMRERGMMPITLEMRGGGAKGESLIDRFKRMGTITMRDRAMFFRQLATMVKAGLNIGNALNILADQTKNPRLAFAIRKVKVAVDSGFSLSGAMRAQGEFSTLMVSVIQAGEEGGRTN